MRDSQGCLATFAGGCFWCIEAAFDGIKGVNFVVSGYSGGTSGTAKYDLVSSGKTAHREAVQISYDPEIISYKHLLGIFFGQIDPTDVGGQFSDRGWHYTTAIFYHTDRQRVDAKLYRQWLSDKKLFLKPIVTDIVPFTTFFPSESYHQCYYKKHPKNYLIYKQASGRAFFIRIHKETFLKES